MPKWEFHGVITPRTEVMGMAVKIDGLDWGRDGDPITGDIEARLFTGAAVVVLDTPSACGPVELRPLVKRRVQGLLDLRCFHFGGALTLEIEHAINLDTGEKWQFLSHLAEEKPDPSLGLTLEQLTAARNKSLALQDALDNRRLALTYHWDTAFYCHRAVECVRQSFVLLTDNPKDQTKKSWERMREALRLTEDWLQHLTNVSLGQRHGDHGCHTSHDVRVDLVLRTRAVIERFVVFLNRGDAQALGDESSWL